MVRQVFLNAFYGEAGKDPLFLKFAPELLNRLGQQFKNGDRFALMLAIRWCAKCELLLPDWAAHAYVEGFDAVFDASVGTWDEAFGRPYKKRAHLERIRRHKKLLFPVFDCIRQIATWDPGDTPLPGWPSEKTPIDERLFGRVDREFGPSKTVCSALYYKGLRAFSFPEKVPTSRKDKA